MYRSDDNLVSRLRTIKKEFPFLDSVEEAANKLAEIEQTKRPRGRPASPAPPSHPISIRVTVGQNEAYKAAGGAKWLKSLLDKLIKNQK